MVLVVQQIVERVSYEIGLRVFTGHCKLNVSSIVELDGAASCMSLAGGVDGEEQFHATLGSAIQGRVA